MNCQDFASRMQRRLDDRLPLESDRQLRRHAQHCQICRAEFDAWQQIASVMPLSAAISKNRFRPLAWSGLAAGALLAVAMSWSSLPGNSWRPNRVGFGEAVVQSDDFSRADVGGTVDPALWWRDVQQRNWVSQTMPAVRRVREGVAPLGRSLLQAVTILTVGGRDRPT